MRNFDAWVDGLISSWLNSKQAGKGESGSPLDDEALGHVRDQHGKNSPWQLDPESRLRHLYVLGCTGCGKTNLLIQLVERDINTRQTVAVLDLRGDLIDAVLRFAASHVEPKRVHLIDLRRSSHSYGLNPFQSTVDPYSAALQVHGILRSSAESWGVQLDETLRCALIMLSVNRRALTDLPPLLTNAALRNQLLKNINDAYVLAFFERFAALSSDKQAQWTLPVLNKVSPFLSHPAIRAVLATQSPIDLPAVINSPGTVLLVALGADRLHALAGTFGCLVVSAIENAAMRRVDEPEKQRNSVHLYLDEFENFQSSAFESIVAEGRRFRIGLTLSHQNLHQLDTKLRHVVMNNAGTRIYFRTGQIDASELGRELTHYGIKDPIKALLRLPTGHAFVVSEGASAQRVGFRRAENSKVDGDKLAQYLKEISVPSAASQELPQPQLRHVKKPRSATPQGADDAP